MPPRPASPLDPRKPFTGFLLIAGLIVLAAGSKSILYDTLDPDCFWHLKVGEQLARNGVGPLRDSLSFASIREPWTPYSWLAEMGMARLWKLGGFRAAVLVTALLISGILVFVALASREAIRASLDDGPADALRQGQRWFATVLAMAFAAFLSLPYLSFRPVTAAIFILSICAWLILRDRRHGERSRAVWLVIPLAVLVVNLHLFAVLLPIWFGTLLIGSLLERKQASNFNDTADLRRGVARYATLCGLSALACTLTPMLPGVIKAMRDYTLRDPMVASTVIGEMQPFWHGGMGKISLVLVLIFAGCLLRRHRRLRAGEMLLLLVSVALLEWKGRFAPLFALMAAPALAVTLPELSDAVLGRPLLRITMAATLCIGIGRVIAAFPDDATHLGSWLNRHGPDAPGYPVDAAHFVANHIPHKTGRLINEFNWGGYLAWELGDRYQVLLDGRTQVYSPQFWKTAYLSDEISLRKFLMTVRADAAVVPIDKSRFKSAMISLGWKTVHHDARADVLVPPSTCLVAVDQN